MIKDTMDKTKGRMEGVLGQLSDNFASVRTGRANAMILDRVKAEYYGTLTPVNQMAAIKTPDAHTLVIEPWDKSALGAIEQAIMKSDLGVTPNNDGSVIRLPFPPLTEERRRELVKQCKTYAEEARIAVRNARRDANSEIDKLVKNENLPEDEKRRAEDEIQKITDGYVASIDEAFKAKEAEVMAIQPCGDVVMRKPLTTIFPCVPNDIDLATFDEASVPCHVAIIMDGNGRWAKKRALNRLKGHKAGIEAVREAIRCANDIGVDYLTIYSFSTENWKRPQEEVSGLMELFAKTMLAEVDGLHEEQVRVRTIGDLSMLPEETRQAFDRAWEKTKNNSGMTLVVAVNYGSRQEIIQAVEKTAVQLAEKRDQGSATLTEELFKGNLYTVDIPDPDLLIRTSGEMRISNFLLWQIAYTELYCTDVLWPDFTRYDFLRAVLAYQKRERRYGAL